MNLHVILLNLNILKKHLICKLPVNQFQTNNTVSILTNVRWIIEFPAAVYQISEIFGQNQCSRRKFLYLLNRNYAFRSQFWRPKINLIFLKMIFLSKYQIRRTTFTKKKFQLYLFIKTNYLVELCPFFHGSPFFMFTKYENFQGNKRKIECYFSNALGILRTCLCYDLI